MLLIRAWQDGWARFRSKFEGQKWTKTSRPETELISTECVDTHLLTHTHKWCAKSARSLWKNSLRRSSPPFPFSFQSLKTISFWYSLTDTSVGAACMLWSDVFSPPHALPPSLPPSPPLPCSLMATKLGCAEFTEMSGSQAGQVAHELWRAVVLVAGCALCQR